jgi:hypothetical protein
MPDFHYASRQNEDYATLKNLTVKISNKTLCKGQKVCTLDRDKKMYKLDEGKKYLTQKFAWSLNG